MAEQTTQNQPGETSAVGPGGVPKGHCYNPGNPVFTCEEEFPSPDKAQNAEWFEGYGGQQQHPMYRTSAMEYGKRPPTVHTMPTTFHCKSQKFSNHLGLCGMPRNHSMNTGVDPTMF